MKRIKKYVGEIRKELKSYGIDLRSFNAYYHRMIDVNIKTAETEKIPEQKSISRKQYKLLTDYFTEKGIIKDGKVMDSALHLFMGKKNLEDRIRAGLPAYIREDSNRSGGLVPCRSHGSNSGGGIAPCRGPHSP